MKSTKHLLKNIKLLVTITLVVIFSQNTLAQKDSLSIDKLRTESGVDPTRVNSRVGYSLLYFDKEGDKVSMSNKLSAVFGINRWSFSVKPEIVTINNTIDGSFETAFSDLKFSILNAFYVNGKNSLAASVEFNTPFGKEGFGSQYFSATPAITYSRTINNSLFLAIQPQYTFSLAKKTDYPNLSVLTNRIFIAKFTSSGFFYVFEPRTIFDLENKQFDLVLSPIIGKSLGGGFNLVGLMEFPTKKSTRESRGVLFQMGFNKNF